MKTFKINNNELSFKQFLEKICQESGLSKEEFYKCKVMLPIFNPYVYNAIRKNSTLKYTLEKRTEKELEDQNYRQTFDNIDEKTVKIEAEINEFYAKTNVTQLYINHLNNPAELKLKFPYDSSIQFSKFTLDINGKIVTSKVIEKEKGKEKYNDAIASGKTGAITSQEGNYIEVNIGNIEPKSTVKLNTEYIQFLKSEDMSYCYSTMKKYPIIWMKNKNRKNKNAKLKNINAKINIKTHSKILRLITKGLVKNKTQKFNEDFKQCCIEYFLSKVDMKRKATKKFKRKEDSDDEEESSDDDEESSDDEEESSDEEKYDDYLKILFRTEKMNNFNLITQYDPNKDETSCIMSMIYNRNDIELPKNDKPDENDKNNYIDLYQKNLPYLSFKLKI